MEIHVQGWKHDEGVTKLTLKALKESSSGGLRVDENASIAWTNDVSITNPYGDSPFAAEAMLQLAGVKLNGNYLLRISLHEDDLVDYLREMMALKPTNAFKLLAPIIMSVPTDEAALKDAAQRFINEDPKRAAKLLSKLTAKAAAKI